MAPDQTPLAAALQIQDAVAVALALRNNPVIVPVLPEDGAADGPPQVRVFRRGDADRYMLLLFSSEAAYESMLPGEADLRSMPYDAVALKDFLSSNIGVLEAVWFDVAGPHAMQAAPQDVLDALQLTAE